MGRGSYELGRGSNELGRGSNELGRGSIELGRGNNDLGRGSKGRSHTKSKSVTDQPIDTLTYRLRCPRQKEKVKLVNQVNEEKDVRRMK